MSQALTPSILTKWDTGATVAPEDRQLLRKTTQGHKAPKAKQRSDRAQAGSRVQAQPTTPCFPGAGRNLAPTERRLLKTRHKEGWGR